MTETLSEKSRGCSGGMANEKRWGKLLEGKNTLPMRPSDEAIERQTEYDPKTETYTARCGLCGKEQSIKKKLFHSRNKTIRLLRWKFDFCDTCNRWVCEDCYWLDDGTGEKGICRGCGEAKGIEGLTLAESKAAWPESVEQSRKRKKAAYEEARAYHRVNRLGGSNGGDGK